MNKRQVKISKFLSLVLRHQPQKIDIALDASGWVAVEELLTAANAHQFPLTREELTAIVINNDKHRFSFSEDGKYIRANQGHSINVELGYQPTSPSEFLYHGTAERFLPAIRKEGLKRMARHHVHLSSDHETAIKVGKRHGKPVVLKIKSGQMAEDGFQFYLSENGVWLTECVPVLYLIF